MRHFNDTLCKIGSLDQNGVRVDILVVFATASRQQQCLLKAVA